MGKAPQLTPQTLRVLEALVGQREQAGADIGRETKLLTGTLYPILLRLEGAGWLQSRWEDGDPKLLGRPRRRYYSITPEGARACRGAVKELDRMIGRLRWA